MITKQKKAGEIMKQKLLTLLLIIGACLSFCACGNDETIEKDLVCIAVQDYETVFASISVVPPEAAEQYKTSDRAILDDETITRLKADMEEKIKAACGGDTAEQVYHQYCVMIDRYDANSTISMAGIIAPDICIDHGVLDFDSKDVNIDGNTATAKADYVGYNTRIIKEDDNKYTVHMTYSKHKCGYELIKENNLWLVTAITEHHQEGMPSGYDGTKGTYNTFEEAYAAALEIDPAEENPIF